MTTQEKKNKTLRVTFHPPNKQSSACRGEDVKSKPYQTLKEDIITQLEDYLNGRKPYMNINSTEVTLEEEDITGRLQSRNFKRKGSSVLPILAEHFA